MKPTHQRCACLELIDFRESLWDLSLRRGDATLYAFNGLWWLISNLSDGYDEFLDDAVHYSRRCQAKC